MAVQARENTMGAPTTGLGQNVTFSFDAPAPVGLSLADPGLSRADVTGGPINPMGTPIRNPEYKEDPTIRALAKFGDDLLAPVLAKKKQEAFVSGMQKAMQGESIQDIVAERPWFARIFGDGDVAEGARSYLGNTRAAEATGAMIDDMPNLRKLGAADANDYYQKAVQGALTGDGATDQAIMQGFARTLPSVMRQQVKENYGFQQEVAAAAEKSSFTSSASRLQKAGEQVAGGYMTQEEFQAQQAAWVPGILPTAGRDFKAYQDSMMDNIINAARAGQFHAIAALSTPVKDPLTGETMSFLDTFKADQRAQINVAIERGAQEQRTKFSGKWSNDLAKLEASAVHPDEGTTTEQLLLRVDTLNEKYKSTTGSPLDLILPEQRAALGARNQGAIIAEFEKRATRVAANEKAANTAATKADAAAAKLNTIDEGASAGNLYALASTPGFTNDEIDNRVLGTVHDALQKDPPSALKIVATNYLKGKYVIKPLSSELDAHVLAAVAGDKGPTEGFMQAYGQWKAMDSVSHDLAAAYYPTSGSRMATFDKLYSGGQMPGQGTPGMPPADAFTAAFDPAHKQGGEVDQKELKRAVGAITDRFDDAQHRWFGGWFGGSAVRDDAKERLAYAIGHRAKEYIPVWGPEQATQVALSNAVASGEVSVIGEHVIIDQPKGGVKLESYFSKTGPSGQVALPTGDTLGKVFNDAVSARLNTHMETDATGAMHEVVGVMHDKPQHLMVSRAPDLKGVPQFTLWATDKEGKVYQAVLSGDDVFNQAKKYRDAVAGTRLREATEMHTGILGSHAPSTRGDFASQAIERARANQ